MSKNGKKRRKGEQLTVANKKKKTINIVLVSLFVLIVGFFAIYFFGDSISREYSSSFLPINNVYDEISYNEFKDKFNSGDEFLLLYSKPSCATCKATITPLNSLAKSSGIKKIYYMNTEKLLPSETKNMVFSYGCTSATPILLCYNDKKVVSTSCESLVENSDGSFSCQYFNGSEYKKDGIVNAAKYIFSKFNN